MSLNRVLILISLFYTSGIGAAAKPTDPIAASRVRALGMRENDLSESVVPEKEGVVRKRRTLSLKHDDAQQRLDKDRSLAKGKPLVNTSLMLAIVPYLDLPDFQKAVLSRCYSSLPGVICEKINDYHPILNYKDFLFPKPFTCTPRILRHGSSICAMGFDAATGRIAAVDRCGLVTILHKEARMKPLYFQHHHFIEAIAFGFEGTQIITGGEKGRAIRWDVLRGIKIDEFDHGTPITCLEFNKANTAILTADRSGGVSVWDIATRRRVNPARVLHDLHSASFDATGESLLITGMGNDLGPGGYKVALIVDAVTGDIRRKFSYHDYISIAAFNKSQDKVVVGCKGPRAAILNTATGERVKEFYDSFFKEFVGGSSPETVAFNEAGDQLMLGDPYIIKVWDVPSGKTIAQFSDDSWPSYNFKGIARDNGCIVAGNTDGKVRLWDISCLQNLKFNQDQKALLWALNNQAKTKKSCVARMGSLVWKPSIKIRNLERRPYKFNHQKLCTTLAQFNPNLREHLVVAYNIIDMNNYIQLPAAAVNAAKSITH